MAALTHLARTTAHDARPDPAPFVTRTPEGARRLELSVPEIHCASCIRAVEGALQRLEGVETARVNLGTRKVAVTWRDARLKAETIVDTLDHAGFLAIPFDVRANEAADGVEGRFLVRCLAIAGFAAGNVMLFSVAIWSGLGGEMGYNTRLLFHILSGVIAVPATLYAGLPFYRSALKALSAGRANMDVPISLGVLLSLVLSIYQTAIGADYAYFDACVSLLFFLLIGRYLDHMLRDKARGAAKSLLAMQSASARRILPGGEAAAVAVRDVLPGDLLLVMPGERVPVDAVVEDGASDVDVSLVSGESLPIHAAAGSRLGAGALNTSDRLTVKALARVEDSLVSELARIVEAGEQNRSRYVKLADKAARLYVPVIHTIAALVFVGWWAWGGDFTQALYNAIATLIITCPCALGLAVPVTQVVAVGRLLKSDVLVKSGDALERLAGADTAVLDKTGTLTFGRPSLTGPWDNAMLADAARLARTSRHPLARALIAAAGTGPVAAAAREVPGFGVEADVDGERWRLGRAAWVGAEAGDDGLELWFARGNASPKRFVFEDQPRPDVAELVQGMKARGLGVHLLSGDRASVAGPLAAQFGIADWRAGVTPQDKVDYLKALAANGRKVLMIGDGLNDAPALAAAHVSIAPASASDAAQASADFVFCGERLQPLLETIDVSRKTRRRILEGFGFAALYNVVAVPFGAAGFVTPLIAAIAMSSSSLVVTLNALRLMKRR